MPRIFDNIDRTLLPALRETLEKSERADFCVGYFNLRGWKRLHSFIEKWKGGDGNCCRLLGGMQRLPDEELRLAIGLARSGDRIDNQTALKLKRELAKQFKEQLEAGLPSDEDEVGLQKLAAQIRAKKVVVKLYLRHPLHAKLYLLFRPDPDAPTVGYLGSSNLTFAGLAMQGELNIDVLDHDACEKLARWFEDRWNDQWCLDISRELLEIIELSWAREDLIPPYHIYIKMAYHLSQEARAGLTEFFLPPEFQGVLFEFQEAAVKIAARHLNKRGGVIIGDVVGLGKTLMATALARIFEEEPHNLETLIICPPNLIPMWKDHATRYRMRGYEIVSLGKVIDELPNIKRFRVVIIDESHNLRNREGKRYRAIQQYIDRNESRCILLSATPYNKTYLDLSNQLRLFVPETFDVGIRPERLLREIGDVEFVRKYQCPIRTLAAFEKSPYMDDWRDLMRLYLVRRTRTFIQDNYAKKDPDSGRPFLTFADGRPCYFPERIPKTVKFEIKDDDPSDQYAKLFSDPVADKIRALNLPRYGLGNYVRESLEMETTPGEQKVLDDLSRAGKQLMGFCRTNLFKRLESSGQVFIESIERHTLRNFVFIHAIENGEALPIGPQDAALLDARIADEDEEDVQRNAALATSGLRTEEQFRERAAQVYSTFLDRLKSKFKWLPIEFFKRALHDDLLTDAQRLIEVLYECGDWDPSRDTKLAALENLLRRKHTDDKVIVFTQFADTVRYLEAQLKRRGMESLAGVTGNSDNPTRVAWRFSPISNEKEGRFPPDNQLRVLVATDVLSEGQNLQDGYIVVNYDLPWAIVRLVQRAGRVDRIGQKSNEILCYSFMPADGVEQIIHLRARVRQRLRENAEVVGTDEAFFEDDEDSQAIVDLYNEKAGLLDDDPDSEVDLASRAYGIWKNAIEKDPKLEKTIKTMPNVVFSTRETAPMHGGKDGALVYVRTGNKDDALAWVDKRGEIISESQSEILRAVKCDPDTPALPRRADHHRLVKRAVEHIIEEEKSVGGQLGKPSGARFKTYERLKRYIEDTKDAVYVDSAKLEKALYDIYQFPLRPSATDALNRQLRSGISDMKLAELVIDRRKDGRLCQVEKEQVTGEPEIICSMGLVAEEKGK